MSYCRFSTDGWKSDVYVYASSDDQYNIHLAGCRFVHPKGVGCPEPASLDAEELVRAWREASTWLDECEKVPIKLDRAGDSFYCDSAEDCLEKLQEIASWGFYVPESALLSLFEEIMDARMRSCLYLSFGQKEARSNADWLDLDNDMS